MCMNITIRPQNKVVPLVLAKANICPLLISYVIRQLVDHFLCGCIQLSTNSFLHIFSTSFSMDISKNFWTRFTNEN